MSNMSTRIVQFRSRLLTNKLLQNTLWMLIGHGSRILIQAVYFILIARILGTHGFGAFVGVVAFTSILSQFTGLGTGILMIKNVSRDQSSFSIFWGNALFVTVMSGTAMIGVSIGLSHFIFPETVSLLLIISIALSDLLFLPLLDISTQAFQAFEKMFWTSQLQVWLSVIRMLSAIALSVFFMSPTPEQWGLFYLSGTVLSAIIGYITVTIKLGLPSINLTKYWSEAKEGLYFCMSQLAQGLFNDSDKTMLPRLSSVEASGIYTSAYRFIEVAFTPIRSLLAASTSRFFKHGASGIEGAWHFAKKIFPVGCVLGFASGIVLYLMAPIVPYILGSDYQHAMVAIQLLSVIPLFKAINYFAADLLTSSGFQGYRSLIQFSVTFLSIGLNFVIIPIYSWIGAAFVGIGANLLLGGCLWGAVAYLRMKDKRKMKLYKFMTM